MFDFHIEELNTFGKGHWEIIQSKEYDPLNFSINCERLRSIFLDTDLCLNSMKYIEKYLIDSMFIVFLDNDNNPQIVADSSWGELNSCRGVLDGEEQNIDSYFADVVNDFLNKNLDLRYCKEWRHQVNWIFKLREYEYLLEERRYDEINLNDLLEDMSYNGYSLHYDGCTDTKKRHIYYPIVKRQLLKQSMLKPLLAKAIGCKTRELYVGKYDGDGVGIKYVVGHLISKYLAKNCNIEKVYGYIKIEDYFGLYNAYAIDSTIGFSIIGDKNNVLDCCEIFGEGVAIDSDIL